MDNQTINNVIAHLMTHNYFIDYAWVQHYGNAGEQVSGLSVIAEELKRLNLIDAQPDGKQEKSLLRLPIRREIENLTPEWKDRPYEYFLSKNEEQEKRQAEVSKLEFEIFN
jgi:hypothetical protein